MTKWGVAGLALSWVVAGCASPETSSRASAMRDAPVAPRFERDTRIALARTSGGFVSSLVAPVSRRALTIPAEVRLPATASGAFRVTDSGTGMHVDVRLVGARDVPGALDAGTVAYAHALGPGVHVTHRVAVDGTEDFVAFPAAPEAELLEYDVALGDVAGVRLAGGNVELLDEGGAPRLRMNAPYVIDAEGRRHAATTTIEGCRYDRDVRAPVGRPVTRPGAASCRVRVSWSGVEYPALVDPSWKTTGTPSYPIGSGGIRTVLAHVPGGVVACGYDQGGEVYDEATGTWSALPLPDPSVGSFSTCVALEPSGALGIAPVGNGNYAAYRYDTAWHSAGTPPHSSNGFACGAAYASGALVSDCKAGGALVVYDGDVGWTPVPAGNGLHADTAWELFAGAPGAVFAGHYSGVAFDVFQGSGFVAVTDSQPEGQLAPLWSPTSPGRVLALGVDTTNNKPQVWTTTGFTNTSAPPAELTYGGGSSYPAASAVLPDGRTILVGATFDASGATAPKATIIYDPVKDVWTSGPDTLYEHQRGSAITLSDGGVLACGGGSSATSSGCEILDGQKGQTCSAAADCLSGFCADGVCCDQACTDPCHACSAAAKGSGQDGTCGIVAEGTDPQDRCPTDPGFPADCKADGLCDAKGACRVFAPTSVSCGATTCSSATQVMGDLCNGGGFCQPSVSPCDPYVCANGACLGTCTADKDCAPGNFCNAGSSCAAKLAQGAACTADVQCTSGHCVDGFCCDTSCAATCMACSAAKKGGGADGTCGNVAAGTDPSDQCATQPMTTCGTDGACDGAGKCRLYAAGTICGGAACNGNSVIGMTCDGNGLCTSQSGSVDCSPYLCGGGACATSCASDGQCAQGNVCHQGGTCGPPLQIGAPCTQDHDCASMSCADGVCCNSKCTGQCEACDVKGAVGSCTPVHGSPHGNRESCAGTGTCGGTCDGANAQLCAYPGSAVSCDTTCTGAAFTRSICDGNGSCKAQPTTGCAPYACDAAAKACNTKCESNGDCASGATCNPATGECATTTSSCKDPHTVVLSNGTEQSCLPYKCTSGLCNDTCSTSSDCVSGWACTGGACVSGGGGAGGSAAAGHAGAPSGAGGTSNGGSGTPAASDAPPPDGGSSGGCGCHVSDRGSAHAWVAVLALAAALARRRAGRDS